LPHRYINYKSIEHAQAVLRDFSYLPTSATMSISITAYLTGNPPNTTQFLGNQLIETCCMIKALPRKTGPLPFAVTT